MVKPVKVLKLAPYIPATLTHMILCVCTCACADLQVQVHQVALVELVDSFQCLSDQTSDLGLWQQLIRHTMVKYFSTRRTGQRQNTHTSVHKQSVQENRRLKYEVIFEYLM